MVRASSQTLGSECSANERQALADLLRENTLSAAHLEIGTAAGGTLKELINCYPDPATRPDFYVIDPFTYYPDQFDKVVRNLRSAGIDPETVTFWEGTTHTYLTTARRDGIRFDFVFIDGDHRHYPVMVDLQWADLVNPGGFICLHDRFEKFPGVGWAIDDVLFRNPEYELVTQVDTLAILKKTRPTAVPAVRYRDLIRAKLRQRLFKHARSIRKRIGRNRAA